MSNFLVVGINHKTAPIGIREKFFLTHNEQDVFLSDLKCNPSVIEGFVISTCNRTEIYANVLSDSNYTDQFIQLITKIKKLPASTEGHKHFYTYTHKDAIAHLLRVICGLDSLVIGEKQILGQLKETLERAQERGLFNKSFNILSNIAIRTGKKAQSETDISYGGSSISWAALVKAEKLLGSLKDRSMLIIGAGKMGELALEQVVNKGIKDLYLMNRTGEKAEELAAKYNAIPASFMDIKEILTSVDACICSVGAPHYILEKATVEKIMSLRQGRPLTLIDISMPRNIDPTVSQIPSVFLSHIDDLEEVVEETMRKRQAAIGVVEEIIRAKLSEFYGKLEKLNDPAYFPERTGTV